MTTSASDARPDQINVVGEGTVFEGTLRAESDVRVGGRVKGRLDVQGRVIVTQSGVIEGEIHATDADLAGSVQGEIRVAERLMLKSTARIDGNIEAGRVKVEEGALFTGRCVIGEQVSEKVQQQMADEQAAPDEATPSKNGALPPDAAAEDLPAEGLHDRPPEAEDEPALEKAPVPEASGDSSAGEKTA